MKLAELVPGTPKSSVGDPSIDLDVGGANIEETIVQVVVKPCL